MRTPLRTTLPSPCSLHLNLAAAAAETATGVAAGALLQETLHALGMANSTYCPNGLEGCVPELAASLVSLAQTRQRGLRLRGSQPLQLRGLALGWFGSVFAGALPDAALATLLALLLEEAPAQSPRRTCCSAEQDGSARGGPLRRRARAAARDIVCAMKKGKSPSRGGVWSFGGASECNNNSLVRH